MAAVEDEDEIDNNCMRWVVRFARWSLVVVFLTIVVCSYYLYVVVVCILTISNMAEKVFFLLIYHVITVFMLWSYFQAVLGHVLTTPEEFHLPPTILRKLQRARTTDEKNAILLDFAQDLPISTTTKNGDVRYCEICRAVKPDRAHHCTVCKRCVLKMDHHCPWINNCVGFSNYKLFHLILMYGNVYMAFIMFSSIGEFNEVWSSYDSQRSNLHSFEIVFLFFGALSFVVVFLPFLIFHLVLVMCNLTTIDMYQRPIYASGAKDNQFSLGCCKNFRSVFGPKPWLWFVPIFTSEGDGISFPLRDQEEEEEAQRHLLERQTQDVETGRSKTPSH